MNRLSAAGLVLARSLIAPYVDNPNLKTAMVGGSVARGHADRYSDLELGIFWAHAPSDAERTTITTCMQGEILSTTTADANDAVWWGNEHYSVERVVINNRSYTGSLMVSVHHLLVDSAEAWLRDVLEGNDTANDKLELVAAIHEAVPVGREELVRSWQQRTATYPTELARRIIRENLWFGPWFWPGAYAQRGDELVLHQHFVWIGQALLRVLAALNRIYYRSTEHKWMDHLILDMAIAPTDLAARLKRALKAEPDAAEHQLRQLIAETIALVEQHAPEADASFPGDQRPWVNLTWAKERWRTDPPYSLLGNIEADQ